MLSSLSYPRTDCSYVNMWQEKTLAWGDWVFLFCFVSVVEGTVKHWKLYATKSSPRSDLIRMLTTHPTAQRVVSSQNFLKHRIFQMSSRLEVSFVFQYSCGVRPQGDLGAAFWTYTPILSYLTRAACSLRHHHILTEHWAHQVPPGPLCTPHSLSTPHFPFR